MTRRSVVLIIGLSLIVINPAVGQDNTMALPRTLTAGKALSIQTSGSGSATLYIVGPGQVIKQDVQLGQTAHISAGSLYNAGRYIAVLSSGSSSTAREFDVVPTSTPADLNFLAKPSRLPVSLHNGITGAVYVLDSYRNLITSPMTASFVLTNPSGVAQTSSAATSNGAAWVAVDSTPQQGTDKFVVQVAGVSSTRIIRQVPGDPCRLTMSAHPSGQHIQLQTEPIRDCNGNAIPDGTIVTFTETYEDAHSTVDVPIKRGIAQVEFPVHQGATISVASGEALGNQIRMEK